jgi:hypothetical protein
MVSSSSFFSFVWTHVLQLFLLSSCLTSVADFLIELRFGFSLIGQIKSFPRSFLFAHACRRLLSYHPLSTWHAFSKRPGIKIGIKMSSL